MIFLLSKLFIVQLCDYKGGIKMIKALVAVRSGSQRVLNKNIRPFAGSSLLEIKIKQLKS